MAKVHATVHQIHGTDVAFLNVYTQNDLPCGVGVWGNYYGVRTVLLELHHKGFALIQPESDAEFEEFMGRQDGARIVWDSKRQP
jgi:hypothetical protein